MWKPSTFPMIKTTGLRRGRGALRPRARWPSLMVIYPFPLSLIIRCSFHQKKIQDHFKDLWQGVQEIGQGGSPQGQMPVHGCVSENITSNTSTNTNTSVHMKKWTCTSKYKGVDHLQRYNFYFRTFGLMLHNSNPTKNTSRMANVRYISCLGQYCTFVHLEAWIAVVGPHPCS